ncbi:hypothetical protein Neosp_014618 [[Neocosmospora] mangrovei]
MARTVPFDPNGHCRARPAPNITSYENPLVDAKNQVPQHQRFYQNAYKNHTPSVYGAGRKVLGYNSYF